jgi:hypothetical protein
MSKEEEFIRERARYKRPHKLVPVAQVVVGAPHKRGNPYAHTRTGYREDLGIVLRSGWEANVCRVLRAYGIEFEFEPHHFTFPVRRGNKGYVPDLLLGKTDEWIEVKGYLDKDSQIKLKRFKKYYPEEFANLTLITGGSRQALEFFNTIQVPRVLLYSEFRKAYKNVISNWE